jgi:hypothetical protein
MFRVAKGMSMARCGGCVWARVCDCVINSVGVCVGGGGHIVTLGAQSCKIFAFNKCLHHTVQRHMLLHTSCS